MKEIALHYRGVSLGVLYKIILGFPQKHTRRSYSFSTGVIKNLHKISNYIETSSNK